MIASVVAWATPVVGQSTINSWPTRCFSLIRFRARWAAESVGVDELDDVPGVEADAPVDGAPLDGNEGLDAALAGAEELVPFFGPFDVHAPRVEAVRATAARTTAGRRISRDYVPLTSPSRRCG